MGSEMCIRDRPVTDRAETQLFSLLLDLDVYSNEKLYKQVLAKRMKLDQ